MFPSIGLGATHDHRPSPSAPPSTISILLIDDDEDQFVLVRRLLTSFSSPTFEVTWSESYSAGLVHLERRRFDVCLVDYQLGQMDGVRLIAEAKTRRPDMPFILVTGRGDRHVDMRAMAAGAIDYLSKTRLDGSSLERSVRYAISDQAHLNAVRREGKRIEALDQVSQALTLEGPSAAGLDTVLEAIDGALGRGRMAIYLVAGDQLTLGAVHGYAKPVASTPFRGGPLDRVLSEGKAAIIPSWSEADVEKQVICEYTIPLTFEARRVGVLTVAISADHPLDDADQRMLRELGVRVGNAIGLHEVQGWLREMHLALRRAGTFAEAAVAEPPGPHHRDRVLALFRSAFPVDGIAYAVPDGDDALVVSSALGSLADRVGQLIGHRHSPAERALATRTVQVDSSGTSCAAFVPVLAGTQMLGLVWVERRGLTSTYASPEIEVLALLGAELGAVISIAQARQDAISCGIRDAATGLYTRAFFDALIATYAATDDEAPDAFGLILEAPRFADRTSVGDEQEVLRAMMDVASTHAADGLDAVALYGDASLAILVRTAASDRTADLAARLAAVSAPGRSEVAVGWAIRATNAAGSLLTAASMALELSRRTGTAIEA